VLALLAFQQLPFSYAGLALLGLGIVFLVLELKVVSYGLLTLAGLVSFVLGSMLLFRGPVPEMRLSLSFVLPVALAFMGLMAAMLQLVVRAHQGRVLTGGAGLITEVGRATVDFDAAGNGQVFVHGELWRAHSDQTVKKGDTVEVVDIHSGLRIEVRLREASPPSPLASQPRS
jgi:membrane-bound serine protease (ClpP class)